MMIVVRDHRGGNWFWIHNAVIDEYGKELGVYGVAIYCVLCRHAGQEQTTWVGQRSIADEVGASRTQVNRTISKLRELGLVHVEDREDEHGRTTSTYTLLSLPCTPQVQGCASEVQRRTPQVQPLSSTETAMINKTHGTRPMEQDPGASPETLWHVALSDLAEQIVPANYERWLARTRLLQHVDGIAVVGVPDQICAEQLARRFDPLVRRALGDALGEAVAVRYQVMEG